MDFPTSALTSAAQAFINAPTPAPAPAVDTPAPPPSAPAPAAPAVSQTAELGSAIAPSPTEPVVAPTHVEPAAVAAPEPIELNDTQLYRFTTKVDGKETVETLTGAEVRSRQMNARKFTQSMQQVRDIERNLARERQTFGQVRQSEAEARAILSDRARLAAHVQSQFPGTTLAEAQQIAQHAQTMPGYQPQQVQQQAPPQAPRIDPDSLASVGDIQSRIAEQEAIQGRRLSEFEKSLVERIQAAEQGMEGLVNNTLNKIATAHEVSRYDQQISQSVAAIVAEMPALQVFPNLEDNLRYLVSNMNPQSPEEMFHFLRTQAQGIHEGLAAHFNTQHQATVTAKARMVASGAEPPAGTPPTFQRKISHRGADGKFDWNALTADAKNRAGSF
jgi:hypothetical protein